jgi:hypothetical protein
MKWTRLVERAFPLHRDNRAVAGPSGNHNQQRANFQSGGSGGSANNFGQQRSSRGNNRGGRGGRGANNGRANTNGSRVNPRPANAGPVAKVYLLSL